MVKNVYDMLDRQLLNTDSLWKCYKNGENV